MPNPEKTPILDAEWMRWLVYPVLAGCCIFFAFERFNILPTLLLLPFFLRAMRTLPLKKKLAAYWIMAVVTNLGGFSWIRIVATDYGGMPMPMAIGLLLLFGLFNNLNFVLWAYLERFFGEKNNPFVIAVLFCVAEQINPQVFPWYFGTALDSALVLYQTADLWGVVGLSFVAMTLTHVPWWLWDRRHTLFSGDRRLFAAQAGFIIVIVGYGIWALDKYDNLPSPAKKSVGVTLVQTSTPMEKFYGERKSWQERLQEFQESLEFTEKAIAQHPDGADLVVWPEGGVHFPILNYSDVYDPIAAVAQRHGVHFAVGSVELFGKRPDGRREYYNAQFVLNQAGEVLGKYRKIVLLAFGEYIPFLDSLPFLENMLPKTISHFSRGQEKPVFRLNEDVAWLPLICYEDIISGFMAGFAHDQADFIVNTTNDGWFGKSAASHLHKQMARPRCVEFRRPAVRTLNTGSSQVIDAAGRTISRETDLYVRDSINTTLHLPQEPPVTVYSMVGNTPVHVIILLVAALWVRRRFFSK